MGELSILFWSVKEGYSKEMASPGKWVIRKRERESDNLANQREQRYNTKEEKNKELTTNKELTNNKQLTPRKKKHTVHS